jgi:hypothetical protein
MTNDRTVLRALLLAAAVAAVAGGCYTTRVHSGMPGAIPAPLATERWHHTLVGGLAEVSDPIDLEALCPQGWASIHEEYTFLNGLVASVTEQIYTPRTYTVTCSGAAPAAGAPPGGAAARTLATRPAATPTK